MECKLLITYQCLQQLEIFMVNVLMAGIWSPEP